MTVIPRWATRAASLAFLAGSFGLIAWLAFGFVAACWVAAFVATAAFPAVLMIGR